jgi:hypothetical protein
MNLRVHKSIWNEFKSSVININQKKEEFGDRFEPNAIVQILKTDFALKNSAYQTSKVLTSRFHQSYFFSQQIINR